MDYLWSFFSSLPQEIVFNGKPATDYSFNIYETCCKRIEFTADDIRRLDEEKDEFKFNTIYQDLNKLSLDDISRLIYMSFQSRTFARIFDYYVMNLEKVKSLMLTHYTEKEEKKILNLNIKRSVPEKGIDEIILETLNSILTVPFNIGEGKYYVLLVKRINFYDYQMIVHLLMIRSLNQHRMEMRDKFETDGITVFMPIYNENTNYRHCKELDRLNHYLDQSTKKIEVYKEALELEEEEKKNHQNAIVHKEKIIARMETIETLALKSDN